MVRATENKDTKNSISSRRRALTMLLTGVFFLIIPLILLLIDPVLIVAKYKLRLTKGSIFHNLLMSELKGLQVAVYVFNITNAEEFLAGTEYKLKVQEIGPFVYQEYRRNDNLDFDTDAGVMRFIPRTRTEFILEKSIGDPKDFLLNVPNTALLSVIAMMSPYPYIVRQLLNVMISQTGSKPIMKMDAYSFLWSNKNQLLLLSKNLAPGLVYHDSNGILEWLYDEEVDYTLDVGIYGDDKLKVKSSRRSRRNKIWTNDSLVDSVISFNNTYEGAVFPPGLTSETPISLYSHGICKTFDLEYSNEAITEFGTKAFVYTYDKLIFENNHLCHSDGSCPYGLMDISDCWFGLPSALSKPHFLDLDPKLLERIEGLDPDERKHSSYILIDPRFGLVVNASVALQLNIVFGDVSYNYQARKFSDFVLPVIHALFTLHELPEEVKDFTTLLYVTGPRVVLASEIACCLIGFIFISYSIRLINCVRKREAERVHKSQMREKSSVEMPLVRT